MDGRFLCMRTTYNGRGWRRRDSSTLSSRISKFPWGSGTRIQRHTRKGCGIRWRLRKILKVSGFCQSIQDYMMTKLALTRTNRISQLHLPSCTGLGSRTDQELCHPGPEGMEQPQHPRLFYAACGIRSEAGDPEREESKESPPDDCKLA